MGVLEEVKSATVVAATVLSICSVENSVEGFSAKSAEA